MTEEPNATEAPHERRWIERRSCPREHVATCVRLAKDEGAKREPKIICLSS
jgi:hypothetical protein